MGSKRFGNQTREQILKHLENLLSPQPYYNLWVDPLGICFEIRESAKQGGKTSRKREQFNSQFANLSKGKLRRLASKKHTRPKIRSVKKGRTVQLKGVVY